MVHLFIVGNGFDIHHGLKTRYSDFAKYLELAEPSLHQLFSRFFFEMYKSNEWDIPDGSNADDFIYDRWCDFEESLGQIDEEDFIEISQEDISEYNEKMGMKEQFVDQFVTESSRILSAFRKWVISIDLIGLSKGGFSFKENDYFVNFNYTETLEKIYYINSNNIFYIHGLRSAADKLVVGHAVSPPKPQSKHDLPDYQFNPFYGYLNLTIKPVDEINERFKSWLAALPALKKITVCGHSLGFVDVKYFETISARNPDAEWRFSYYSDKDLINVDNLIERLNLREEQIMAVAPIVEIESNPSTSRDDRCVSNAIPLDKFLW
ncbi:bacteriophage abortive infection AbiH family protein [Brucella anthropi]|uniref:Bacteriophage abortive infection AbiH n=2 Tax=Brucella anthropi TaxID=529 RepID=A0A6L3Z1A3_BRUAN|nr:bacteriophage abortive infection AbiH family protein [Brucella anthropi]KAB2763056.1 hypothetical protein F9L04_21705 [Brucella anthropi]UVV67041.1 bacteriophage abortive infection AbiH family protein [Brucella anthropi]